MSSVEKKCLRTVTLTQMEVECNLKTHLQMRPSYRLSHPSMYVSQMKHKLAMNYFSSFPAPTLRSVELLAALIVVGPLYLFIFQSLYKDRVRLCVFIKAF